MFQNLKYKWSKSDLWLESSSEAICVHVKYLKYCSLPCKKVHESKNINGSTFNK